MPSARATPQLDINEFALALDLARGMVDAVVDRSTLHLARADAIDSEDRTYSSLTPIISHP